MLEITFSLGYYYNHKFLIVNKETGSSFSGDYMTYRAIEDNQGFYNWILTYLDINEQEAAWMEKQVESLYSFIRENGS